MAETDRRRSKQIEFNEEHGIEPKTIQKRIADIMQGARDSMPRGARSGKRVAEAGGKYDSVRPEDLVRVVAELEQKMYGHAERLEFEEAARTRDEIKRLKERVLKTPEVPV